MRTEVDVDIDWCSQHGAPMHKHLETGGFPDERDEQFSEALHRALLEEEDDDDGTDD